MKKTRFLLQRETVRAMTPTTLQTVRGGSELPSGDLLPPGAPLPPPNVPGLPGTATGIGRDLTTKVMKY